MSVNTVSGDHVPFFTKLEKHLQNESVLDSLPSSNPCSSCGGIMTVGEAEAGGVCSACYYKYSDHDSSTGE